MGVFYIGQGQVAPYGVEAMTIASNGSHFFPFFLLPFVFIII